MKGMIFEFEKTTKNGKPKGRCKMTKEELARLTVEAVEALSPCNNRIELIQAIAALLEPHIKTEQDEKKLAMLPEIIREMKEKGKEWNNRDYDNGYYSCIFCEHKEPEHHNDCIITRLDAVKEGKE
jgi:hypothetical protein